MSAVPPLLLFALVGLEDVPDDAPPVATDLAALTDEAAAPGDAAAFQRLVDQADDWEDLKTQDQSIPAADALRTLAAGEGPFAKAAAEALRDRRSAVLKDMARRGVEFRDGLGGYWGGKMKSLRLTFQKPAPPNEPHPLLRLRLLENDAVPWARDGEPTDVYVSLYQRQAKLTDAQFADLCAVPRLARLYVEKRGGLGPAWRGALTNHPTLAGLEMERCGVTAEDCAAIATIPNLRSVELSHNPIGDDGLRALAKNPTIIWFNLEETGITDAGLRALAGHPEIEHIDLRDNPVTDVGFTALPLRNALFLHLSGTRCGDGALQHMIGRWSVPDPEWIKRMEEGGHTSYLSGVIVDLDGCPVTDAGLRHLAAAPVDTLSIRDTEITGVGFDRWNAAGRTLPATLKVDRSAFNDEGCAELARGRVGQRLRMSLEDVPGVTAEGIRLLRTLPRVKGLNVRGRSVTDEILAEVAKHPDGEPLWIWHGPATGTGLAGAELEQLVIMNKAATDEGVRAIATIKGLWRLQITGSPALTDAVWGSLADAPDLLRLSLSGAPVAGPGMADLAGHRQFARASGRWERVPLVIAAARLGWDDPRVSAPGTWADLRRHAGPALPGDMLAAPLVALPLRLATLPRMVPEPPLPVLRHVDLRDVGMTDDRLRTLPPLPVRGWHLSGDPITADAVVDFLRRQPDVELMSVADCPAATGDGPDRIRALLATRKVNDPHPNLIP